MKNGTNKQKPMEQEFYVISNRADNVLIWKYDNLYPLASSYTKH